MALVLLKLQAERADQQRLQAIKEAEEAKARAYLEKIEAEKRRLADIEAARQAEIRRQEAEKQAEEDEKKRRKADMAHRKNINTQALNALITGGIEPHDAKTVVTLIAPGKVPNVRIEY